MTEDEKEAAVEAIRVAVVQAIINTIDTDSVPLRLVLLGITNGMASIAATESAQGEKVDYREAGDALRKQFMHFAKNYEPQIVAALKGRH